MDEVYPFAAIIGQTRMKRALLLCAVDPRIGGVLLSGQKGTAKSTVCRSLAELCHTRLVEVPLNVTEDMLVGAIDFEKMIQSDTRICAPGILARADGAFLYVDEINLLPDSIVSIIETVAASGVNLVEREGISCSHPARFTLIGSMNPEEGKLRPQLLDRFGLYVAVSGETDEALRVEIMKRRLEYERDHAVFRTHFKAETDALANTLIRARQLLPAVRYGREVLDQCIELAAQAWVQGNRCELLLLRTARAAAALDARTFITRDDLLEAASFVLPHRRQEPRMQEPEAQESSQGPEPRAHDSEARTPEKHPANQLETPDETAAANQAPQGFSHNENCAPDEETVRGENFYDLISFGEPRMDPVARLGSGRRLKTVSCGARGRYAGYSLDEKNSGGIALDATIRAAAPYQAFRAHEQCAIALRKCDFRYKICESRTGAIVVFAVDASGSMGANRRMKAVKEAAISMLLESYQKRDKVALVAFRKDSAETLLDVTGSVDLAQAKLQSLPTGGRTPLATGLLHSWQLIRTQQRKDAKCRPILVVITDGRANSPLFTDDAIADVYAMAEVLSAENYQKIVIDTEQSYLPMGIPQRLAYLSKSSYYKVDELRKQDLRGILDVFLNPYKGGKCAE